jgi:hypothetical protein
VYLETVSDNYLDILTLGGISFSAMAAEVTRPFICNDGTHRPSFAPTVSGGQECTDGTECGPFLYGWLTRGEICSWELGVDICVEGVCAANECDNPLDFCENSCTV